MNSIQIESCPVMTKLGLIHGVTGRAGGVSAPPYDSLNLAYHVGDEPPHVTENRQRLCRHQGLPFERLTACQQTHGNRIQAVNEKNAGRGGNSHEGAFPETDGLMTNVPGIPLLICTADCVPVILYEPQVRAAAVLHSGWKGTAADIGGKGVRMMKEQYGAAPERMYAYIGTAITAPYFEIGETVAEQLAAAAGSEEGWLKRCGGAFYADLYAVNRRLLRRAGIPDEHIYTSVHSSYENRYYSYRRDGGRTGRMAAFAMIMTDFVEK